MVLGWVGVFNYYQYLPWYLFIFWIRGDEITRYTRPVALLGPTCLVYNIATKNANVVTKKASIATKKRTSYTYLVATKKNKSPVGLTNHLGRARSCKKVRRHVKQGKTYAVSCQRCTLQGRVFPAKTYQSGSSLVSSAKKAICCLSRGVEGLLLLTLMIFFCSSSSAGIDCEFASMRLSACRTFPCVALHGQAVVGEALFLFDEG